MASRSALAAVVAGVVLGATACTGGAATPATTTAVTTSTATTTTTPAAPPTAAQVEWAKTFCAGQTLVVTPKLKLLDHAAAEPAVIKAVVLEMLAAGDRASDDLALRISLLDPLGPDVAAPQEELVKALRYVAERYAAAEPRIEALATDAKFDEAYRYVLFMEIKRASDDVDRLFRLISGKPAYQAAFDNDQVCQSLRASISRLAEK